MPTTDGDTFFPGTGDMKFVGERIKVLVADDDPMQRLLLRSALEEEGYVVVEAENGKEALELLENDGGIRFLLTDIHMPEMDGFELIKTVREREVRYVYIIVLTQSGQSESLLRALSLKADDFLRKPVDMAELKLRLTSGIRLINLEGQEEVLFLMAKMAESKDEVTGKHLERVCRYTRLLARDFVRQYPEYGMNRSMADEIAKVSMLHDVGKMAVPDHIIAKPGSLTSGEWEIMKTHTVTGGKLLKQAYDRKGSPYLLYGYQIAMYHHERWKGGGYPEGISGEEIPVSARIVALTDVYDALTRLRPYKEPFSHKSAREIIIEGKGSHFDPKVVACFQRTEHEFVKVCSELRD